MQRSMITLPSWYNRPLLISVVALFLLSAGCKQKVEFDQVYTVIEKASLHPGDTIPQPAGATMLTVWGKIGTTNGDGIVQMDRATIEQVGVVEYSVKDPFSSTTIRYSGVLMRDLLALWQVPEDAQTVYLTALNDYAIDIPISDFYDYPVLFALQADGVYMEPDYQGPAMLVYPVDQYDFEVNQVKRNWIWQIKSIELK